MVKGQKRGVKGFLRRGGVGSVEAAVGDDVHLLDVGFMVSQYI